ncbi:MAG: NAD-dependent epimerase/dehydratase family protein [Gemmatimonadetes bacterium]|nr:NAD-dependent epimerase/dehydratase family protein [Gemmatimonadota bacterium]MBI2403705.1 NAD-dependent epimerase/dehydratase family protein [Gemmatimonadota bacterium]MBI2537230.1 NAD-dependent epimerase/dehydratase family protein [Gemmatimonadota bacterium]MBI2616334.1 NAD-dependent epimerase/dehydratase family protein [Gemmatimonadota bacterium]
MTRTTFVTGATGFIGQYVLRRLLARNEPVRVLARRPDLFPADVRRRLEVVAGDVRDRDALARGVAGAHTVLHLAAFARAWSPHPEDFTSVNVDAVRSLLELAAAENAVRLVHVSTILTLPPFRPAPVNGRSQLATPYERSKREGESLVEAHAAAGHHAVIVHPTRVYGPGPLHDANGVTKAVALYLRGRLRVRLADGNVLGNYVHADDVAAGILLAAARGRRGAHYVLGGENASFRDLLELATRLTGIRRAVVPLPPGAALAVARVAVAWGHVTGRCPITPSWVRVFLEDRRADISPAREDLGYRPRALAEGLRQTLAWWARNGGRLAA